MQELTLGDLETVQTWALESLRISDKIAADEALSRAFGVKMRMCTYFHTYRVEEDERTYAKTEKARENCKGFHWGVDLVKKYGVCGDSHGKLKDGYEHHAAVIDTDVAMAFLMQTVRSKGAKLHTDTIIGDLLDQETHLLSVYGANAIVNATGIARETAADKRVYPLRGAVIRVINNGSRFPKIESCILVAVKPDSDGKFRDTAFIVPRNDNTLLLGDLEQAYEERLDLTVDSPEIKEMRQRCESLLPMLKHAQFDPQYPLAQGLRPYRDSRVRIERENRRQSGIVHCYGHGGAGWSLAFGSSRTCVRLVERVV